MSRQTSLLKTFCLQIMITQCFDYLKILVTWQPNSGSPDEVPGVRLTKVLVTLDTWRRVWSWSTDQGLGPGGLLEVISKANPVRNTVKLMQNEVMSQE